MNSFGVLLATIGAYLVWRYLTELNFIDKEAYLRGEGVMAIPDPTPAEIASFKRSLRLSKLGLTLIALGGVAQIFSNHLPPAGL
ncbi:hypothetical protein [Hydrogenophaga sp.]|uniref:hypothetical protein n=1 Tax=Hydrogenophaga sp. TaxID=1904254 RepID=UPI002724B394|nr:hypothetical protein [Hydrogenophaga sp.]MDO9100262.1 hypothetical protein [Caldisericota bacterium]MDP1686478.1 hypothetical protein [Hydrogenophaga sp.]